MMNIESLGSDGLEALLAPAHADAARDIEIDLNAVFSDLLQRANAFLPSEAGAILIDRHPAIRGPRPREVLLVAAFGGPPGMVGKIVPPGRSMVDRVCMTGRAHILPPADDIPLPLDGLSTQLTAAQRSAICAPLILRSKPVGAVELLNRRGNTTYDLRELSLLEIFARTISAAIGNSIDAQWARETAKRDDLTGLYNDRHLYAVLTRMVEESLTSGTDIGLSFVDLDHFKKINDTHGHLIGSRVLRDAAALVRRLAGTDALVARYGGDEFVVVLKGAGEAETQAVAESIRAGLERCVFLEHADADDPVSYPALAIGGVLTCSLGVAALNDIVARHPGTFEPLAARNELLATADASLYRAKRLGRNRTVCASRAIDG